jgi:hypothetical protein
MDAINVRLVTRFDPTSSMPVHARRVEAGFAFPEPPRATRSSRAVALKSSRASATKKR